MKWSSGTRGRGGNRATSLTGSDAGGHAYGKQEGGGSQLEEGVRLRVVLPRDLAEKVDVIAHVEWGTPQDVIRQAVKRYCSHMGIAHADAGGVRVESWWQEQLEAFRQRGEERSGL